MNQTMATETEVSPHLMIVEDEPVDVIAMRRALDMLGFRGPISVAGSSREAIDKLRDGVLPDVILLDLDMPGDPGLAVLQELQSWRGRVVPPTVVLTSSTDENDTNACFRAGAAGYFVKPLSWDEMRTLLSRVLEYWTTSRRPNA